MEKANRQLEHRQPMEHRRCLFLHMSLGCGLQSITTPVSLLAKEFDVRSLLHEQVSLAAVNQICVVHVTYKRLQKSKDSLKDCFQNVNTHLESL